MRKRVLLVIAALLVALVGLAIWVGSRQREPVYEGKTLTAWLEHCLRGGLPEHRQEAEVAIRHIGTNALPVLLKMAQAEDSPLRMKALTFLSKHPSIGLHLRSATELRMLSSVGFGVLKSTAKPAVPALIQLLQHRDSAIRGFAAEMIRCIGPDSPEAVPALVKCLNNDPVPYVRLHAIRCLGYMHAMPELAVPALLRSLEKPGKLKTEAFDALVKFGEAKAATAAICQIVEDQRDQTLQGCQERRAAISLLGSTNVDRELAMPAVTRALDDPSKLVRSTATNFFLINAPAAAAKAGVDVNALIALPGAPDPHGLRVPVVR